MAIIKAILEPAIAVEFAVAEAYAMAEVIAVGSTDAITTQALAHLRSLDAMPVLVLAPGPRPAVVTARLYPVFERVLVELFTGLAVAAAGVGFHLTPPHRLRGPLPD